MRPFLILFFAVLCGIAAAQQHFWGVNTSRLFENLKSDDKGNVVGASQIYLGTATDVAVTKRAAETGAALWNLTIPSMRFRSMTIDSGGRTLVCGGETATPSRKSRLVVIDGSGAVAWDQETPDIDVWTSVCTDAAGSIWLLGLRTTDVPAYWLYHYSSEGNLLGSSFVARSLPTNFPDGSVIVDESGDVLTLSTAYNTIGRQFAALAKFGPDGLRKWIRYFGEGDFQTWGLMAVQRNGTIHLAYQMSRNSGKSKRIISAMVSPTGDILESVSHPLGLVGPPQGSALTSLAGLSVDDAGIPEVLFDYLGGGSDYRTAIATRRNGQWHYEFRDYSPRIQTYAGRNLDRYRTQNSLIYGPGWQGGVSGRIVGFHIDDLGDIAVSSEYVNPNTHIITTHIHKIVCSPLAINDPAPGDETRFQCQMGGERRSSGSLLDNDFQWSQATIELASPPSRGTVEISDDGHFTYRSTPSSQAGEDSFVYRLVRRTPAEDFTSEATVTMTVIPNLQGLSIEPPVQRGGLAVNVSAQIEQVPNIAFYVKLTESSPYVATTNVRIPPGQTEGSRSFSTLPVSANQVIPIQGSLGNRHLVRTLTLTPQ